MILVAGATGALGSLVVGELLDRGSAVRVLVRPGSDYGALVEAGAQPVMGDLKDPESLARACAGVTTVVTTANSARRGGADTTDSVDRAGNRALITAAGAAGVQHFVFVSALGASNDSPVAFLRAKAETEEHLRRSGMDYSILQPNLFMDVWIPAIIGLPLQQGRPVTLVGRGDHRHSLIALRDVAAFTAAAVSHPAARNQVVVVAGPEAHTWTEIAAAAGAVLGRTLDIEYIPPGQPLPGLPDVVSDLATALESYETVIDMTETADLFGVRLTPLDSYLCTLLSSSIHA